MGKSVFRHVSVKGIAMSVPTDRIELLPEMEKWGLPAKKARRLANQIGMNARHVVDSNTTATDLALDAAKRLMRDMKIAPESLDACFLVTQSPDWRMPASCQRVHKELGLPTTTPTFDVNQGCAGYVYGLWLAHSMVESGACRRVLMLAADASIQKNPQNRITAPVFGDAGSATLLEYSENAAPAYFNMCADGRGYDLLIAPAGGAKIPFLYDEKKNADLIKPFMLGDNVVHLVDVFMDGNAIFRFTMDEVPPHIRETMRFAGITEADIDGLVLHQANKQIIENIAWECEIPLEKAPWHTFSEYGNQTICSIPGVLNDVFREKLASHARMLMSGFGVGLAWGSCVMEFDGVYTSGMADYVPSEDCDTRDKLIEKFKEIIQRGTRDQLENTRSEE